MPLNFMHLMNLEALGIIREIEDVPHLDPELLAAYKLPAEPVDTLVLQADDTPSAIVRVNRAATRIDPVAAQALWRARGLAETEGILNASAWCTACGRHFIDGRAAHGHVERIAKWCDDCRNTRRRHLPQLRLCAADDCDVWFEPSRQNQMFHTTACKSAASRAA